MSSKIQGIVVEIGGDTTKLGDALKKVNEKTKDLQGELKGVNTLLKLDPSNVNLLKQKQDILTESIANTKSKLEKLKEAHVKVKEQFDKGEITIEQYRDFQRELISTENKLKNLENQSKSFGSVTSQQIINVGNKMESFGKTVENVGKKFMVVSTAASAILVGVSKVAIDFETAFTGVTKTVDGTEEELNSIKVGILELSKATSSSATDIAAVSEAAGQLGVKTENILAFTETMVKLGDSTNLSADEAATAIAQLYNVMGSDINTVDKFGSALVDLGNNAATTESDILNMATRIASSGKQVGLTEQEVLALATSLSSVGLEAEGGGSAISAVITKIDKDVALNTESLETWASVASLSVSDFKNLWETDAMSAIQKVVRGMGDATNSGENLNIILDDLGITSIRQTDTMKRLSGASELMSEMVNISNKAWDENSALTTEASKRYEATASKIQQLKNTITELAVKLGEILLPVIQSVVNALSKFVNWLSNLNPTFQKVIVAILAFVAVLGPLLITVGKIISSIGSIITYGPKIISIISTIKTTISGLISLVVANPIILIITAIVVAIVVLYNKCEWFRNFVNGLIEQIKNSIIDTWNRIKEIWDFVYPYFVELWNGIVESLKPVIESLIGAFQAAWEMIKTIWDLVQPYFSVVWENIKTIYSVVGSILGEDFQAAWKIITSVWNVATSYFKAIFDTIKYIFSFITSVLHGDFSSAWKAITSIVDTWKDYFQNEWNEIKNVFSTVAIFFTNSFQAAWDGVKKVFSNVGEFFFGILNSIKDIFSNVGTTIGDVIGNSFKSVINSVLIYVQNKINQFIRNINSAISSINTIPGVNISKISELNLPKLKVGMSNVPYDNYLALLHKGERVLTAKENKEYNKNNKDLVNNNVDNSFNLTINSPKETSPAENARLMRKEWQRYKLLHT